MVGDASSRSGRSDPPRRAAPDPFACPGPRIRRTSSPLRMTSAVSGELRFEEAGLRFGVHRLDDIFDVAVEEGGQVVPGVADAVVGHPVLGEVVGTYLLGALAGADLGAAGRLDLLALPALLDIEDAGAEDGHRLVAVLELGALVLADGDDAGGDVGDADGGGVLLDVLAAVAAGVEDIDPQLL